MRRLLLLALLGAGCSEPARPAGPVGSAAPVEAPKAPPVSSAAPGAWAMGTWTVTSIDGQPPPASDSPIRIAIDSSGLRAAADCALLAKAAVRARETALSVEAPPPGIVMSCARGLSPREDVVRRVLQPGATAKREMGELVFEREGRVIRTVRLRSGGPGVRLALLPRSDEGDAAAAGGALEVVGPCLYVRTINGARLLPAFMTADTRWDPEAQVLWIGERAFAPGALVMLGGSQWSAPGTPPWRQAPDPACDASRVWTTVSLTHEANPGGPAAGA